VNAKVTAVIAAAVALMILRVDFWWWNRMMLPTLFGWLSVPMLYQLGILLCGWALAVYAAGHLWTEDE
jgi:hypothetical protein